jgi:formiminotetrahydrofolate cyclodeaminase
MDDRTMLARTSTALGNVQAQLLETIETETAVKIFAAHSMPQGNDIQRTERETAIQIALRAAADVPLEVMRLSALALKHAETVAARSCLAASSDVELAVALLRVAFDGARSNLERKLSSLTDVVYTESIVDEIARLTDAAAASARVAKSRVQLPPA